MDLSRKRKRAESGAHYQPCVGEVIAGRYEVLRQLGGGHFSVVLLCWDRQERRRVAVKVVRSERKYFRCARAEVEMHALLRIRDEGDRCGASRLIAWDEWREHMCLIFDQLGPTLLQKLAVLKRLPPHAVRRVAQQLLRTVAFLHRNGIIHTDLKLENLLLEAVEEEAADNASQPQRKRWRGGAGVRSGCSSGASGAEEAAPLLHAAPTAEEEEETKRGHSDGSESSLSSGVSSSEDGAGDGSGSSDDGRAGADAAGSTWRLAGSSDVAAAPDSWAIRVIDFGSAQLGFAVTDRLVTTRHYRAPEVVLQQQWSYSIDLWSIGCIMAELASGQLLFNVHSDSQHLLAMQVVLGPLPPSLFSVKSKGGDSAGERWSYVDGVVRGDAESEAWLLKSIASGKVVPLAVQCADKPLLLDLLLRLLAYEPSKRSVAELALEHAFFKV
eukprot:PLAT4001.3.p1 GENE.PLAT4001.3~~PLAT4001.3.p1  ORF type:complete len:457 (-),score=112.84 PLAT4001.3:69-1391(-)